MDPNDIFRIFIATDNHLGAYERDPVRSDDSFAAVEEIFVLAKESGADLLLLGGDLFHENKPSRRCLQRTMEMFRRHCLGDEPVSFEVISDPEQNFRSQDGMPNYMHPHYSIGLPVFMIHGNHDDPSREAGAEPLSALDLLAASNLINYFGRCDKVDDVEVAPVLLRKGRTKVALYGLGWIRDERLNRMWHQKKVKFLRPRAEDGRDDFFNIFVVHQNRDTGRGKKNCVHEAMIPAWMDLVIWGHEHECRIEPEDSLCGTFRIVQPGSSVATSLTPGEAKRKEVAHLDVCMDQWRTVRYPLQQVRAFSYNEMSLRTVPQLNPNSPKVEEEIMQILEERVREMIDSAVEEDAGYALEDGLEIERRRAGGTYRISERKKPLIRLRVEHSGFPTVNAARFGMRFMDAVANPQDLLLCHRRKVAPAGGAGAPDGTQGKKQSGTYKSILLDDGDEGEGDRDDVDIAKLVETQLAEGKRLKLLVMPKMIEALDDFVKQSSTHAIDDMVDAILHKTQDRLKSAAPNAGDLQKQIQDVNQKLTNKAEMQAAQKRLRNAENRRQDAAVESLDNEDEADEEAHAPISADTSPATASASLALSGGASLAGDSDDEYVLEAAARRKQRGRSRGNGGGRSGHGDSSSALKRRKLEVLTVPALKKRLKDANLKAGGKKADLVQRLLDHESGGGIGSDGGESEEFQDADDDEVWVEVAERQESRKRGSMQRASRTRGEKNLSDEDESEDGIVDDADSEEDVVVVNPKSKRQRKSAPRAQDGAGGSTGRKLPAFFSQRTAKSRGAQEGDATSISSLASAFT